MKVQIKLSEMYVKNMAGEDIGKISVRNSSGASYEDCYEKMSSNPEVWESGYKFCEEMMSAYSDTCQHDSIYADEEFFQGRIWRLAGLDFNVGQDVMKPFFDYIDPKEYKEAWNFTQKNEDEVDNLLEMVAFLRDLAIDEYPPQYD